MANYHEMDRDVLTAEKAALEEEYKQFQAKGLKLNMARGKPGPHQMDLAMDLLKMTDYTTDAGTDARNYGELSGLKEAKEYWADVLGCKSEECFIGGNASLTLMYDLVSKGYTHGLARSEKPWCRLDTVKWLCPAPGYDRHFAITEEFGFELISVPMTPDGPDMDIVEKLVAEDDTIKAIWCVPMYSNPGGVVYSDEVVKRFAALKPKAKDFRIFWDNAYCVHHLVDNPPVQANLLEEAKKAGNEDICYMFASTSKITHPGSGIAMIAASQNNLAYLKKALGFSTIGYDKMNQLRHLRFFGGKFENLVEHMKKHKALIAPKFQIVENTLEKELADLGIANWSNPKGGYFISFNQKGCAKRIVSLCKEAGVVLTGAGASFPHGVDPEDENIRISPTFPTEEELQMAMNVFVCAAKLAAAEQALAK